MSFANRSRLLSAPWSIGEATGLACLLEASAVKAGNVHPSAAFADMDYVDFLASGVALIRVFDRAAALSVGELALAAVEATRARAVVNTTLGTVLLFAPLSRALALHHESAAQANSQQRLPRCDLRAAVRQVLSDLSADDARDVYAAICLANPGGLGNAAEHDVRGSAPLDLKLAMSAAADIDAVARQYVNGFDDIFDSLVPWLVEALERTGDIRAAVSQVQLRWLSRDLDGLIVRKAGRSVALEAQQLAELACNELAASGKPGHAWQALDDFLRLDGHRRNPGTTADLIAAALFVMLSTAN